MKAKIGHRWSTVVAALALAVALAVLSAGCGEDEMAELDGTISPPTNEDTSPTSLSGSTTTAPAATSTTKDQVTTTTTAKTSVTKTIAAKPAATPKTINMKVYFMKGEEPAAVTRQIPYTHKVGKAAVELLLAGPTADEKARGLSSEIPAGTKLRGLNVENGVATVDLTAKYESGGGTLSMHSRLGQLVYTLTEFPTVQKVQLRLEGKNIDALGGEGLVIGSGLSHAAYDKLIQADGGSQSDAVQKTRFQVYFARGEKLVAVQRNVAYTPEVGRAAVTSLLAGPTASEVDAGMTNEVPAGVKLNGLNIKGGCARVDLSGTYAAGGGSLSMHLRLGQLVYTLTQFPTVDEVELMLDGRLVSSLGGEGLLLDGAVSRGEWKKMLK